MVGLNVCDNAVKDQAHWNENCFWVDGKISLLGPIVFEVDLKAPMKPWLMEETSGRLQLAFTPDGGNEPIKIAPIGLTYYQKCGRYDGYIIDDAGERHEVGGYYGEAEDFELGYF